MRSNAVRFAVVVMCLVLSPRAGSAQGFQGGLRGAVHDSSGVVPGVEVTITNESTGIKRSVVSNEVGEYTFRGGGTRNLYGARGAAGIQDRRAPRDPNRHAAVSARRPYCSRSAPISENVTVTGQSPIIDTANASKGDVLDSKTLETLPAPGRNAFMIGVAVPTVAALGDSQFNRQQDQTNASLLSLGGGVLSCQQLSRRRRADQ